MFWTKKKKVQQKQSFMSSTVEFIFLLMVVFLIRTFGFGLYQVPTGSMETTMLVGERFFADKLSYWFRAPRRNEIIAFNAPGFKYSTNPMMNLVEKYAWGPSNWTKRVIGVPGDHVQGKIEDGKPVVYVNGKKLDEPYLNAYPLIHTFKEDPAEIHAQVNKELKARGIPLDSELVHLYREQRLYEKTAWRSYDPSVAYENQPFYTLDKKWIIKNEDGESALRKPGVPQYANVDSASKEKNRVWTESDEFDVLLKDDEYWGMGDNRRGSYDCRYFGPIKKDWIHGRILFRIWSVDSNESWAILDVLKHPIDFWKRVRWSRFLQCVK